MAGLAAFGAVVLYWLVRRPRITSGEGPVDQPVTTGDPTEPVQPVGPEREDPRANDGSCDLACDDSCSDSCNSTVNEVCDDLVDEVCEKPLNDACGSMDSACGSLDGCGDTGGCDPNLSCDSSTRAGQFLLMLTGGQPWLAVARPQPRARVTLPARLGVAIIRGYQRHVSRALGTACRYSPSCSEYGVDALRAFGGLDGAAMTVARIRRCTVAVPHGTLDPV